MKAQYILDTLSNVVGIYYPKDNNNMTVGEVNLLPEYIMTNIGKFVRHYFSEVSVVSCNLNKSWLQQSFVSERKTLEISSVSFPTAEMAKGYGILYHFEGEINN